MRKCQPPQDLRWALRIGLLEGPGGGAVSYERGTRVLEKSSHHTRPLEIILQDDPPSFQASLPAERTSEGEKWLHARQDW